MKYSKVLIIFFVLLLSSCTTTQLPEEINCDVTPDHEDCVIEEANCDVTPDHEDCVVEEVNCDVTPDHEDCVVEEVNCDVTPDHEDCVVEEPIVIKSCEELGIGECSFVLAEAISDGSFVTHSTYEFLTDADQILEENSNPNMVVIHNGKIVNMKYGIINFKTKSISEITLLAVVGFNKSTYLNGNYNVDGLFLDSDNIFTRGVIAGVEFELLTSEIQLIPHIQAKNAYSYYTNTNDELIHHISSSIQSASFWTIGPIDQAPYYLNETTRYYSYDSHYFYTDIVTMTDDINNDLMENAVNYETPYYNYYQYLSFRSKTNYTADELDSYLNSRVSSYSALYDSGQDFINAQEDVFINAALELSFAIHESGWGASSIAIHKNNLFGINAVDSSPYDSATTFGSIEECIEYHVSSFLQTRYFNPYYSVSFGTNLGNKAQGMNFKYASDAYWGEKIAKYYYDIDKELGFKDYNSYKIVLLDPDALGYFGPNPDGLTIYDPRLYNYYGLEIPFVVVKEKTDFYVLQLPVGLNDSNQMDTFEIMLMTDVFYVYKEDATLIN